MVGQSSFLQKKSGEGVLRDEKKLSIIIRIKNT
jgi:hypothetical protein